LAPPERPKSIVFGAGLPVALGKAADLPIAPVAGAGYTEPDGSFTHRRREIAAL
jgi:hypothetical protein